MFNTTEQAQGWSDTPLTDEGIAIAEQLGKGLKNDEVEFVSAYSSDLGRARETAKLVLQNNGQKDLQYTEDQRFREVCYGVYEGDTNDNMWTAIAQELGYESSAEYFSAGKVVTKEIVNAL